MRNVFVYILGLIIIGGWALSLEAVDEWNNTTCPNMPALQENQWKPPQDMVEAVEAVTVDVKQDIDAFKEKVQERKEAIAGDLNESVKICDQVKVGLANQEVRTKTKNEYQKEVDKLKKEIATLKEKLEAFMKEMKEKYGDEEGELADEEGLAEKSEEVGEFAAEAKEIKEKVQTLKEEIEALLN